MGNIVFHYHHRYGLTMEYNIGFNPETTAARWGNPQTSAFGNAIRGGFNPLGGANYEWFPFQPYAWPTNYYGQQAAGVPPSEYLHGEYRGYTGIIPLDLQSVSPELLPFELPYPLNRYA
jgi:hypothetical protein